MSLMRGTLLWCSENRWMRRHVPRLWFVRRAVKRFMPGEELEDALAEATVLNGRSVGVILTQLGENLADPADARAVVEHYRNVIRLIAGQQLDAVVSVKPTQLGLDHDPDVAYDNMAAIIEQAAGAGQVVWCDMEQSGYVAATLAMIHRLRDRYDNVGVCLQAYLYRTQEDIGPLLERGIGIRLVKGAYAEPPEVAFASKQEVDENYFALAMRMLDEGPVSSDLRPAFATHDGAMIERIRQAAAARSLASDSYQFQMLYGIQRSMQDSLTDECARVMVLISYGAAWYPWYVRRLAERPANVWFVVKSLVGA